MSTDASREQPVQPRGELGSNSAHKGKPSALRGRGWGWGEWVRSPDRCSTLLDCVDPFLEEGTAVQGMETDHQRRPDADGAKAASGIAARLPERRQRPFGRNVAKPGFKKRVDEPACVLRLLRGAWNDRCSQDDVRVVRHP